MRTQNQQLARLQNLLFKRFVDDDSLPRTIAFRPLSPELEENLLSISLKAVQPKPLWEHQLVDRLVPVMPGWLPQSKASS